MRHANEESRTNLFLYELVEITIYKHQIKVELTTGLRVDWPHVHKLIIILSQMAKVFNFIAPRLSHQH